MVEETNRLDADVVALTGDFINHSLRDLPAALDVIRALRARHITAACEGNHDLIENAQTFRRDAERGGLPLLLGETATTTIRGQRVQLLGLPWHRSATGMQGDAAALLARRDPGAWPLLLAHHPHAWDFAGEIPLTLSGHTHGGQLMLTDRIGAGPLLFRYWSGLYTRAVRRAGRLERSRQLVPRPHPGAGGNPPPHAPSRRTHGGCGPRRREAARNDRQRFAKGMALRVATGSMTSHSQRAADAGPSPGGGSPLPRIAVTMGDPAGVGPELCLRLLADAAIASECVPVVFGDAALLRRVAEKLGLPFTAPVISMGEWSSAWRSVSAPGGARSAMRGRGVP